MPRLHRSLHGAIVAPTAGIDLPLKALLWQDRDGRTWLGYNDPSWLFKRHSTESGMERLLAAMTKALAVAARQSTTDDTGVAQHA